VAKTYTHTETGAVITVSGVEDDYLTGLVANDKSWRAGKAAAPVAPTPPDPKGDELFDPSGHTVDDVKAYLDGLPEDEDGEAERQRVLTLESEGKARAGLLGG
jgi:hypothetical protein